MCERVQVCECRCVCEGVCVALGFADLAGGGGPTACMHGWIVSGEIERKGWYGSLVSAFVP